MIKPIYGADGPILTQPMFRGAPPIRHSVKPVFKGAPQIRHAISFKSGYPVVYAVKPEPTPIKTTGLLDYMA